MKKITLILLVTLLPTLVMAQSARKLLMEGDFHMGMNNYEEAEQNYASASTKKASFKSYYNTGVSQEKQIPSGTQQTAGQAMEEPQENPILKKAILSYATATGLADDGIEKSRAYYNMGNTHKADKQSITIEKLESAIEAYKKAIENDSINYRARHNLAITQLQLDQAKQQEQQEQQQQQEQEQEENEDQENQDQQEQQQQEQEEQEQSEQEKQEQQKQNEEAEQREKEEKEEISKAEMEKILEMVEREDQEVQQKMRAKSQSSGAEKKKKW